MIRDAVIVATDEAVLARVGGLSLLERALLTAAQAGLRRAVVLAGAQGDAIHTALDGSRARAGIALTIVAGPSELGEALRAARGEISEPFVLVPGDRVYSTPLIAAVAASDVSSATAVPYGACGLIAGTPALLDALDGTSLADVTASLRAGDPGDAFWHDARTPEARKTAERELIKRLRKPSDGPIARNIIRPISLQITKRLMNTSITPNQITLGNAVIGFVGMAFVAQATWLGITIGAALFVLQCILDHPDGEIARLKFLGSRTGQWLDHISDDISNTGYGLSLGYATTQITGEPIYFWLGVAGGVGLVLYNLVLAVQLTVVHRSGSPFDFRWWFQKDDVYVKDTFKQGGSIGGQIGLALHACARRDVFLFAFLGLCLLRIPEAAVIWHAVVAGGHGLLSIVHIVMRRGLWRPGSAGNARI